MNGLGAISLLLVIGACAAGVQRGSQPAPATRAADSLSGVVHDSLTDAPLMNAQVFLTDDTIVPPGTPARWSRYTDAAGRFLFSHLPVSQYLQYRASAQFEAVFEALAEFFVQGRAADAEQREGSVLRRGRSLRDVDVEVHGRRASERQRRRRGENARQTGSRKRRSSIPGVPPTPPPRNLKRPYHTARWQRFSRG